MTTYSVTMDDGSLHDIPAVCAANAVQTALERNLGKRALTCISGRHSTLGGEKSIPGLIHYDIPEHSALPLDWTPVKRVKAKDGTTAMFNEDEIKAESINAKERASRSTFL